MLTTNVTQQMLSSLALFKGIANSHKGDVWAIVRDFIVATVKKCNLTSFNIQTLREEMIKEFNIDIENAVLIKVINNLDLFTYESYCQMCTVTQKLMDVDMHSFDLELSSNRNQCEKLLEELYAFYCQENNIDKLEQKVKILLQDCFFRYIIDKENLYEDDELTILINRFALKFENDAKRKVLFSNIRQGLIMLEGLNYSKSTDSKTWPTETTFFLDAHYLFSYYGLNSTYHKKSVEDFIDLVNKINDGCPVKYQGRKRIILTYFSETKAIMDTFFEKARRIKNEDEKESINNSEAMKKILDQCEDVEDVILLKNKFYKFLEKEGIEEYSSSINLIEGKDFLYEKEELEDLVKKSFQKEEYEEVYNLFLYADYINILREGVSVCDLEKCKYIFLTDKNLCIKVSNFLRKNDSQARTRVFEKMDWFTERMWYLTCQSFIFNDKLTSFDLAIKAKMVLSGICKKNLSLIYEELKKKELPDEEMAVVYQEMRNYAYSADNIDNSNSKEIVEKFSSNALDQFHESYLRMVEKANRTDDLEEELQQLKKEFEGEKDANQGLREDNNKLYKEIEALKRAIRLFLWISIPLFILFLCIAIIFY